LEYGVATRFCLAKIALIPALWRCSTNLALYYPALYNSLFLKPKPKTIMKRLLLLLPALFLALHSHGQWTPDSTVNTMVADQAGIEETAPMMATTSEGFTYVSWFTLNQSTSMYELYMQLLDTVGVEMWTPGGLLISSQPQSQTIFRYALKVDNLDNAIVAFQDLRQGSNYTIAVYKLDKAGNHIFNQNGTVLFDSLAVDNMSPVIGVNRSNQTIIAWNASDANNKWVSLQKLNAAGGPLYLGPKRVRDATGAKKFSRPQLIPASDTSGFLMMYVLEIGNFPGVTSTMQVQRYNDFGIGMWNNPVNVSSYSIPYFFFPSVLSDKLGGFWLAFNAPNPANTALSDVFLQHVDSAGLLWSATGNRVSNSVNEQKFYFDGCLARTPGGLMVAIQVTDVGQTTQGISVQAFTFAGTTQLGSLAVSVVPQGALAATPFGLDNTGLGAILCYSEGVFSQQYLYAKMIGYSGVPTWTRALSYTSGSKDDYAAGEVVNAQLVTVWQDTRNGSGIYAQNISSYGTAGVLTGIQEANPFGNISIYPNPGDHFQIGISNPDLKITGLEIMDQTGRIVAVYKSLDQVINLQPDVTDGLYFIRLNSDAGSVMMQWMKQ
jgi:hypothetical protein